MAWQKYTPTTNDKLLPVGTYLISVQAVGGEFCDGGLLSLRFAEPLPPEALQSAVAATIQVFLPKTLEVVPKGAWWHINIAWCVTGVANCQMAGQERIPEPLQSEQYLQALSDLVPRIVGGIALSLATQVGVMPAALTPDPAERPALLN